ncbi:hypothetical protein Pcac1_g27103 [Phytophthora cactorum]|nr:hypothetical protein Pcac1_g27103 [Phytophthora cactorum]
MTTIDKDDDNDKDDNKEQYGWGLGGGLGGLGGLGGWGLGGWGGWGGWGGYDPTASGSCAVASPAGRIRWATGTCTVQVYTGGVRSWYSYGCPLLLLAGRVVGVVKRC